MFPTQEERPLFEFTHTFSAINAILENSMEDEQMICDLYLRELPKNRNYLVFAGLEEVLKEVITMKFSQKTIDYLLEMKIINDKTADYLKKWKFSGDLYTMDEGSLFFGYEPVIKIKAKTIDAQLLNINLINSITSHTLFTSKFARLFTVCKKYGKLFGTGPLRAQSFESGHKATRAAYICGATPSPMTAPAFKMGIKPITPFTIAQHSWIMSFNDEETAMKKFMESAVMKDKVSCMTDTYDYKKGLLKYLDIIKSLGIKKATLFLDSGDLYKISKEYKEILDKEGFKERNIIAASNLNEHTIQDLCKKGAEIDRFVVVTEMVTSVDSPFLDFVYKLAQIKDKKETRYCGKLSKGKISFPGDKQVLRKEKNGKFDHDVLCLTENQDNYTKKGYKPLLKQYVKDGKIIKKIPDVHSTKEVFMEQIEQTPDYLKNLKKSKKYEVKFDPELYKLLEKIKVKHL